MKSLICTSVSAFILPFGRRTIMSAEMMHSPCGGVTWPAVAASEETETHDASVSPHQTDPCLADHTFKRVIYGGWVMRQTRSCCARGDRFWGDLLVSLEARAGSAHVDRTCDDLTAAPGGPRLFACRRRFKWRSAGGEQTERWRRSIQNKTKRNHKRGVRPELECSGRHPCTAITSDLTGLAGSQS